MSRLNTIIIALLLVAVFTPQLLAFLVGFVLIMFFLSKILMAIGTNYLFNKVINNAKNQNSYRQNNKSHKFRETDQSYNKAKSKNNSIIDCTDYKVIKDDDDSI